MGRGQSGSGGGATLDDKIERGLRHYSEGDLDTALGIWRGVLDLDPQNQRASAYVRYVEDHYELLSERFSGARAIEPELDDGHAVLVIEAYAGDELPGDDAYDSLELASQGGAAPALELELDLGPAGPTAASESTAARAVARAGQGVAAPTAPTMEAVDAGWSLDDGWTAEASATASRELADDLRALTGEQTMLDRRGDPDEPTAEHGMVGRRRSPSAPPKARAGTAPEAFDLSELGLAGASARVEPAAAVKISFRSPGTPAAAPASTLTGLGPAAARQPAREAASDDELTTRTRAAPSDDGEEALTVDRLGSEWSVPRPEDDATPTGATARRGDDILLSFDEDPIDLPVPPPAAGPARAARDPERDESSRERTGFYERVSPAGAAAAAAGAADSLRAEIMVDLDEAEPPQHGDESLRRRMTWLIERVRVENQRGGYPAAVMAIDLALDEQPESAVAQKIVHRSRDLMFEVYRHFLGDLAGIPSLAVSMSELASRAIDHRAAFLLSRIDGSMSLDDLLDVSGMPRLEAYRHLCRLILDGIVAVR